MIKAADAEPEDLETPQEKGNAFCWSSTSPSGVKTVKNDSERKNNYVSISHKSTHIRFFSLNFI